MCKLEACRTAPGAGSVRNVNAQCALFVTVDGKIGFVVHLPVSFFLVLQPGALGPRLFRGCEVSDCDGLL